MSPTSLRHKDQWRFILCRRRLFHGKKSQHEFWTCIWEWISMRWMIIVIMMMKMYNKRDADVQDTLKLIGNVPNVLKMGARRQQRIVQFGPSFFRSSLKNCQRTSERANPWRGGSFRLSIELDPARLDKYGPTVIHRQYLWNYILRALVRFEVLLIMVEPARLLHGICSIWRWSALLSALARQRSNDGSADFSID